MIWFRCSSCGGVYPEENDGTPYSHVCPGGTKFPRDENPYYEIGEDGKAGPVTHKKGKARNKGGAIETTKPEPIEIEGVS